MFFRRKWFLVSIALVIVASLAFGFGRTMAEDSQSSEPAPAVQNDTVQNGEQDPEVAELQDAGVAVDTAVDSEGNPVGVNTSSTPVPVQSDNVEETLTPEEMQAATITYFKRYPGTAFTPRDSDTGYDYFGNGCISSKGPAYFTLNLQLPTDAEIDYMRLYFYDTSTADARLYLTWYDGQGLYGDVDYVDSSGTSGYGTAGIFTSYVVDPINQSIDLIWRPNTTGSSMALCGVRIRYQVPFNAVHLPIIENN